MIFDHIENIENYKDFSRIYEALRFLSALTEEDFPSATVHIDGDDIFANPSIFCSKPIKDCVYEGHRKYIDIHYIVSGVEGISTANVKNLKVSKDYVEDILFFESDGEVDTTCWLTPGCFMVCFPNDAHQVAIMRDIPAEIKKIVVKVKI